MMKKIFSILLFLSILFCILSCDIFQEEDTSRPSCSITSPSVGETLSGTITISVNASDNSSIYKVVFYCDNIFIGEDTSAPYSLEWDTSTTPLGSHELKAIAYDDSANSRTSAAVPVTIGMTTATEWSEDFSSYNLGLVGSSGQSLDSHWLATGVLDSDVYIAEDPLNSGHGKVLFLDDDSGEDAFTVSSLTTAPYYAGTLSFDILMTEDSYFYLYLAEKKEITTNPANFNFIKSSTTGNMTLNYYDGADYYKWSDFSLNQWYTVTIAFDCINQTYTLTFNGFTSSSSHDFKASVSSINNFSFSTNHESGFSAKTYIDNIHIIPEVTDTEAPDAPSDLIASMASSTSIQLDWTDNSNNEDGFYIYRYRNLHSKDDITYLATVDENITSYTDSGLTPGESYGYYVYAYNGDELSYGDEDHLSLLAAPINVSATQGTESDQISLSWDSVTYAEGYIVYRYDDVEEKWEYLDQTTTTSYINSTSSPTELPIDSETHYFYFVTGYNTVEGYIYAGEYSETVEGWSGAGVTFPSTVPNDFVATYEYFALRDDNKTIVIDTTARGSKQLNTEPPVSFTHSSSTAQNLWNLFLDNELYRDDWTPIPSGTGYTWSAEFTVTWGGNSFSFRTSQGLTEAEIADVEAFSDYYYDIASPAEVTDLTASNGESPGDLILQWSAIEGASQYRVYQSTSLYGEYSLLEIIDASGSSTEEFTISGSSGTNYYKVKSVDILGGSSDFSNAVNG